MSGMTEDDRRHAREVLERKWLTIEEVTTVREAVEKTGVPFLEAARAKGLLTVDRVREMTQPPAPPPPPKAAPRRMPPLYAGILIVAALILIGSDIYFRVKDSAADRRLQQEEARIRQQADQEAILQAEKVRAEAAREEREKANRIRAEANALRVYARDKLRENPHSPVEQDLKEATNLYSLYLAIFPDDVDVLIQRAEVHELRRAREDAVKDLQRARDLDPTRAKELDAKILELSR